MVDGSSCVLVRGSDGARAHAIRARLLFVSRPPVEAWQLFGLCARNRRYILRVQVQLYYNTVW